MEYGGVACLTPEGEELSLPVVTETTEVVVPVTMVTGVVEELFFPGNGTPESCTGVILPGDTGTTFGTIVLALGSSVGATTLETIVPALGFNVVSATHDAIVYELGVRVAVATLETIVLELGSNVA
jgi:hypothetical protein